MRLCKQLQIWQLELWRESSKLDILLVVVITVQTYNANFVRNLFHMTLNVARLMFGAFSYSGGTKMLIFR